MHALDMCAPAEVFAPRRMRSDLTEQRLREFRPEVSGPVRALARRHRNLRDLAASFPALLFALAHPRHGFNPEAVIRAVVAGEPLSQVACMAQVPRWLRHMPPAMFACAVPALPDSHELRRMIVNHLPKRAKHAAAWLDAVANAALHGNEEFVLWCARHLAHGPDKELAAQLRLVALWSWYSAVPGTRGHALVEYPFHPAITVKGAIGRARVWKESVQLHLDLADAPVADTWHAASTVNGFDFVPLRREEDIREEAQAMQNCLRTYGSSVARGHVRLWRVRRDGARAATLSVRRDHTLPIAYLGDIKAAQNKAPTDEVVQAAHCWFFLHVLPDAGPKEACFPHAGWSRAHWNALWKPYWLAKRRIPQWLPLRPSRGAILAL